VLVGLSVVGGGGVLLGAAKNVTGHGGCSDRKGCRAEEEKEEMRSGDGGDSRHRVAPSSWHADAPPWIVDTLHVPPPPSIVLPQMRFTLLNEQSRRSWTES
jgi:hypothetical protein